MKATKTALILTLHAVQDMICLLNAFRGKGAYKKAEKVGARLLYGRLGAASRIIDFERMAGEGAARSARLPEGGKIGSRGSRPLRFSPSPTPSECETKHTEGESQ